ncbi:MAG TPA: ABC-F family ATP-binding cassette domain-containing protein, partial [Candidatus Cloacimonadota bacterium]|nr:ABC-F family ATP-binding cassette domain-containing protein [Candidatus Cloacimonadota bacterium]
QPHLEQDKTLLDIIYEARKDLIVLKTQLMEAEHRLSIEHSEEAAHAMGNLQDKFNHAGGYTFDTEIKLVLTSLNFTEEVWKSPISQFSGGEQTRIHLAKILLQPYDLLLLDEPTNHLDIDMIFWLEKYLSNLEKPYVIISHDRYFLDKTAGTILELDNGHIERYSGNYSFYAVESALRKEQQLKAYQAQQKLIEKTEDFIRRNMAGQKTIQAQSRQKMLDRMEIIEAPQSATTFKIQFNSASRTGNDVFRLEDVTFGYPGKDLAQDVNLYAGYRDRIAILGRNGCGKTSLLNLLMEELKPSNGIIRIGANLKIGYYEQFHDLLNPELTARETIWQMIPNAPQGEVLGYLARFGFRNDDVEKKVASLSGGERARLNLARLIMEGPNVLLLDEPTNHLDLTMTTDLEQALLDYDGTILFVSHDRYFIRKIATKIWIFRNMTIEETLQDLESIFASGFNEKAEKKVKTNQPEKNRVKKINPWNLEQILKEIDKLHTEKQLLLDEKAEIEFQFTQSDTYKEPETMKTLRTRLEEIEDEVAELQMRIEQKEDEYLELSS